MVKILSMMCVLIIGVASCNKRTSINDDNIVVSSDNVSTPKNVLVYKNIIYTANICTVADNYSNKGFMTETKNNRKTKKIFTNKLNDPKGFQFISDNMIMIADNPSIKLLNLETEEVIDSLEISNALFLNNLELINNTIGLVGDSYTGKLYKITINNNMLSAQEISNIVINGISAFSFDHDNQILYVSSSTFHDSTNNGTIYEVTFNTNFSEAISLKKWKINQVGSGRLNGLKILDNGQLIVSDLGIKDLEGASKFYILDIEKQEIIEQLSGFTSIGDFDIHNNILYFPDFLKKHIRTLRLNVNKKIKK